MISIPPREKVVAPQEGPQSEYLSTVADIAFFGGEAGGGKTYGSILDHLRWSDVPDYSGVIFRRTCPQLTGAGSLWEEMNELYPQFGAKMRGGSRLDATFPSGATVQLCHLQHEDTKRDHQGKQYTVITFEEVTHFTETQFWYLVSRNRSAAAISDYVRATCNPDASSWVAKLVGWWIDQNSGYAIPERSGVIRWFARVGGRVEWGETRNELIQRFPSQNIQPKSFTFIHSTLDDNPAMLLNNPEYRANLEMLPPVERERLSRGNWKIVDHSGGEWPAEYFLNIWFDRIPDDEEIVFRVAALDPSVGRSEKSDYQALVCVSVAASGNCYVDADVRRSDVKRLADRTMAFIDEYQPDELVIESNGFQELLAAEIEHAASESGVSIPVYQDVSTKNKLVRIRRLGTQLARGRLLFRNHCEGTALLVSQMQEFPNGDHDDGPDALEMAIRHADDQLDGVPDYYQAREPQAV